MFALTYETLLLLAMTVVPGFVANRVYHLICPTHKTDTEKNLLEFIAYSLFNLALWSPLIYPIVIKTPQSEWVIWQVSCVAMLVCFISPATLAIVWANLRKRILHTKMGMDHPTQRGWDHFLETHGEFYVLFHLKNGKMLGGYFGRKSLASKYPQEPEIYVEEVIKVDEDGKFTQVVEGTLGAVVRQSEWERVEFLEVKYEESVSLIQGRLNDGEQESPGSQPTGGPGGTWAEGATGTIEPASPTNSPARGIGDSTANESAKT